MAYTMDAINGMVDELLSAEHGLSDWEIDFLENINKNFRGRYTPKQAETVAKIWNRLF